MTRDCLPPQAQVMTLIKENDIAERARIRTADGLIAAQASLSRTTWAVSSQPLGIPIADLVEHLDEIQALVDHLRNLASANG